MDNPLGSNGITFGDRNKQKESLKKATGQFKNPIGRHIVEHMEMFAKAYPAEIASLQGGVPISSPLTALDIAYYSVYGDYRLMGNGHLEYQTNTGHHSTFPNYHPFEDYLSSDTPGLSGVNSGSPGQPYRVVDIEWFNSELVNGDSGQRFGLPSLGTMIVREHGFKDITSELIKAMTKECTQLIDFYNYEVASDEIGNVTNAGTLIGGRYGKIDGAFLEANIATINAAQGAEIEAAHGEFTPIIYILGEAMKNIGLNVNRINRAISTAYYQPAGDSHREEGPFGTHEDLSNSFFRTLFKRYGGMRIDSVVEVTNLNDILVDIEAAFMVANQVVIDTDSRFFIDSYDNVTHTYHLTLIDPDNSTDWYEVEPIYNLPIPQANVKGASHPDFPNGRPSFTKLEPTEVYFQRRVIDTYFAVVTVLYMYAKIDNYSYVSPGVNFTNKVKLSRDTYPNMLDPIEQDPAKLTKSTDSKKGIDRKASLINKLKLIRQYVTISSIINERVRVNNKKVIDDFYSGNILLKEVSWLTQALVDSGSVIYEKTPDVDLISQLQYKAIPASGSIQQIAEAPRATVFYQVDAPLLRDVIYQYTNEYNYFVTAAAQVPTKTGKRTKAKKLQQAYWGSLTSQANVILKSETVKPHDLFSRLFTEVSQATSGFGSDFPPSWMGTNHVSQLTSDPARIGTTIEKKFYEDRLKEYVEYIRDRYRSDANLASRMLSVMESFKLESIENVEELRQAFIKRLESDAKNNTLLDTGSVFRAYATLISILRATIDVPLRERREFIAKGIDDRMVKDIQAKMGSFTPAAEAEPILPRSHPQYKAPEEASFYDPESALGEVNIANYLPIPKFYPKLDDTLNTRGRDELQSITHMVTKIADTDADDAFENLYSILGDVAVGQPAIVTYTVQGIDWQGRPLADQIWDTRSNISETPTLLRMVQRRATLGIRIKVEINDLRDPGTGLLSNEDFLIDLIPYKRTPGTTYVDFSDYSSVFFRKEAYDRAGGFVYPNPVVSTKTWDNIAENVMSIYVDNTNKGKLKGLDRALIQSNFQR